MIPNLKKIIECCKKVILHLKLNWDHSIILFTKTIEDCYSLIYRLKSLWGRWNLYQVLHKIHRTNFTVVDELTLQHTANALRGLELAQPSRCSSLRLSMNSEYNRRWIGDILTRITCSSLSGRDARNTVWPRLKIDIAVWKVTYKYVCNKVSYQTCGLVIRTYFRQLSYGVKRF